MVSGEDAAATFRGINDGSSFGVSWDVGRVDEDEVPDLAVGMHGRLNLFLAEL